MACTNPSRTFLPADGGQLLFREPVGANPNDYSVFMKPCGVCESCLEMKAREWSLRSMHEAQMHERNSFVTLTYAEEFLTHHGSLNRSHAVLFLKRLRKALQPHRIRYLLVGEYGSTTYRAHYHALIFGEDFTGDRVSAGKTKSGFSQYESALLSQAWGLGRCTVQDLTLETAMYCCRYALKSALPRVPGKRGERRKVPWWQHPVYGVWLKREREFQMVSRHPGLGRAWFEKYSLDVVPHDACVVAGGQEFKPPRYYDRVLRAWCEDDYLAIKAARFAQGHTLDNLAESVPARLQARAIVQAAKHSLSGRNAV